jgi:hypothetical protein
MRRDGRSSSTAEYSQTARRTAEYRLVGAGGRRDGGVQATGRPIGEGCCRRRQSNEGREKGICDQIVGFACSLADRAGLFPLFSRPESPSVPRGPGWPGLAGWIKAQIRRKRRNRGHDWTVFRRPDEKKRLPRASPGSAGDALRNCMLRRYGIQYILVYPLLEAKSSFQQTLQGSPIKGSLCTCAVEP